MVDVEVVVDVVHVGAGELSPDVLAAAVHVGDEGLAAELVAEEAAHFGDHGVFSVGEELREVSGGGVADVVLEVGEDVFAVGVPGLVAGGCGAVLLEEPGVPGVELRLAESGVDTLVEDAEDVERALIDEADEAEGGVFGVADAGVRVDVGEESAGELLPVVHGLGVVGAEVLEDVHGDLLVGVAVVEDLAGVDAS